MEIQLTLSIEEINVIINALSSQKFSDVYAVFQKVQFQAQGQINKSNEPKEEQTIKKVNEPKEKQTIKKVK